MIVCAGNNETFSFSTPMGVGLVDMTLNLTRACIMNPPEFLLFVGTAGSYGHYKPFDIVESMQASQIELSFLEKNAYTPIDNVVAADAKNVSHETMVNSSNYISTNKELSSRFTKMGIGIENMEFFAFLRVAQEFDIPAGGIFIVTNYTDENAHEEFKQNHKLAMDKLAGYIDERMSKLFAAVSKS